MTSGELLAQELARQPVLEAFYEEATDIPHVVVRVWIASELTLLAMTVDVSTSFIMR
jgi:hypothetical protein